MAEKTFVSPVLIVVVTTYLLFVGISASAEAKTCVETCNLRQGYCAPDGCRCFPGYEGENCERCTRAPGCLHGTCHQSWQCNCKPGWGGLRCDQDLKICERTQPCQNEATCINGKGSYTCVCQKGFKGARCEIYSPEGMPKFLPTTTEKPTTKTSRRIPAVLPRQCQNGGRCTRVGTLKRCEKCICKPGYVGRYCEINVNECLLKPCANGGKCFDLSNDYYCQCERGFTGRFCEKDVDECALTSDICFNGGICNNTYGSYDCTCPKGYTGSRCGEKIMSFIKVPVVRPKTPDVKPFTPRLTRVITEKTTESTTTVKETQTTKRSRKVVKNPETEIKMTRITHELKISSVNGEYSAANNELLIRQEIERDTNASNTSTQAMQAMTFVFMGLAIVILAAILALVWLRCFRNQVDVDCSSNKKRSDSPDCEAPPTPSVISSVDQYVTNNRMPTFETVVLEHDAEDESSVDESCMQIQPCLTNQAPLSSSNESRQSLPACNSPPPPYAISAVDERRISSRPISSGYYVALPPMTQQRSRQNISESRKSLTTSYGVTSHDPEETSSLLEADSPTLSHKIVV